ncbi:MAG: alpha-L-fucosidase [Propionibacteriaceae bacterium]|nr:alpha-L-fucosidase [Propionibacteriaceae bacterium]
MSNLRQVHLDFHNSDAITSIGDQFDPAEFAETMARAHVTSVNVFAKCLHGFSYYPTEVGTTHPGLCFDLFGQQVAALRARSIKAVAYVSVLWDDLSAKLHPEWVAADRNGRLLVRPALSDESAIDHGLGWSVLDLASDYPDYVVAQVEEISQRYEPDGFWFDIVPIIPNYSPAGVARMQDAGIDVSNSNAVRDYYLEVRDRFIERIAAAVRRRLPGASIAYNQTTDGWLARTIPGQGQVDIESLPTDGSWGYLHYPVMARYARTFGLPVVGMTGRFHRSWSDFGGLKTADQLTYEVGTILSGGGAPSIGDQLDPSGQLAPAVYQAVGAVFDHARKLEPWLADSTPVSEAAVVAQWERTPADAGRETLAPSDGVSGAAQLLLEQAVQFDVMDAERLQPGRYRLLVVPDDATLGPAALEALAECRQAGATLLTAGQALPDLPGSPARLAGPARTQPSFFRVGTFAAAAGADPDFPYACYGRAWSLAVEDAATAGQVVEGRFNRSWKHFTSHTYTPVGTKVAGPLLAQKDGWAHLAIPAFSDYAREGYWPEANVAAAVIRLLLPERRLSHDGPPWVEATLHEVAGADGPLATVVHLTAFQPRRSTHGVPRVDTAHGLVGFPIRVRTLKPVTRAYSAPSGAPVPFRHLSQGHVEVAPTWTPAHHLIVLEHTPSSMQTLSRGN